VDAFPSLGDRFVAFMGELSDISVADLLYLLSLRRQSGKLTITANGDEVNLFLSKGQLALVTSTNLTLRLGKMLVRLGMLDSTQLRDALQEQEQSGRSRPLGSILIDHGWITEEDLAHCVEEQCVEILARVIAAEHGIFVFNRGAILPIIDEFTPLNADHIVLEATRRTDELIRLKELLPGAATPLALTDRIDEVADTLSDTEIAIASAIHAGVYRISELTSHLAMDDLAIWRAVLSMRERGLIETPPTGLTAALSAPPDLEFGD
jgi:hypothetical protein